MLSSSYSYTYHITPVGFPKNCDIMLQPQQLLVSVLPFLAQKPKLAHIIIIQSPLSNQDIS